jgi:hypothetical protein
MSATSICIQYHFVGKLGKLTIDRGRFSLGSSSEETELSFSLVTKYTVQPSILRPQNTHLCVGASPFKAHRITLSSRPCISPVPLRRGWLDRSPRLETAADFLGGACGQRHQRRPSLNCPGSSTDNQSLDYVFCSFARTSFVEDLGDPSSSSSPTTIETRFPKTQAQTTSPRSQSSFQRLTSIQAYLRREQWMRRIKNSRPL